MTTLSLVELPESQRPQFTAHEGYRLLNLHYRRDAYLDDLYEVVALDVPRCANCAEPWGEWGCSTVRAVAVLGMRDVELRAEKRRTAELTEALTPRFGVHRLADSRNETVELRMRIDRYTLLQAGMPIVYATLEKMGSEFKAWFKKIGDRERIAADHTYALSLDSDYYTDLTQEFSPSAPYFKAQNAPWDTP